MAKIRPKVNPQRRLQYSHPYDIYKTIQRLKVHAKLTDGDPNKFYSKSEIAANLFSNWADLSDSDRRWVIISKIQLPLWFLVNNMCRVEEEQCRIVDRFGLIEYKGNEMFRARPPLFSGKNFATCTPEQRENMEFECIKVDWYKWRGR